MGREVPRPSIFIKPHRAGSKDFCLYTEGINTGWTRVSASPSWAGFQTSVGSLRSASHLSESTFHQQSPDAGIRWNFIHLNRHFFFFLKMKTYKPNHSKIQCFFSCGSCSPVIGWQLLQQRFLKVQKSQLLLGAVFVTLLPDDHLSKSAEVNAAVFWIKEVIPGMSAMFPCKVTPF